MASAIAYPVFGGLMIASSIYHLLAYNGNVLGISGIYGSALSTTMGKLLPSCTKRRISASESTGQNGEGQPLLNHVDANQPNKLWTIAFTAGLLAGGALLRASRTFIEKDLGVRIFDYAFIGGRTSNSLIALFMGAMMGVGTKVFSC
jgi:hypothetical protein